MTANLIFNPNFIFFGFLYIRGLRAIRISVIPFVTLSISLHHDDLDD